MRYLTRFNEEVSLLWFQFFLSIIFLFPYFFKQQVLYGEAQFFSSWDLWLKKTGGTWLSFGLGEPTAQGVGNNFPVLYMWSFLERLGFDFNHIQFFWYLLLFFLPFLFLFFLASRVFKLSPVHSFLAASFYVYNPIFLSYWINLNPWLMPAYYLIPLFWLVIGLFWYDNRKTLAWSAIALFTSLYIFANPPYLVIFLISITLAIIFYSIYFEEKIFSIFLFKKFVVVYSTLFLVANFIIVSILLNYRYSISSYESTVNPVNILKSNSEWSQLSNVFIFKQQFFDQSSFSFLHNLMNSPALYPIFAIPLVLVFLILIAKKREKPVYFILFCVLITLFFIKGLNPPFSALFLYIFEHFPLFNMFKTASEKFSPLYIFLITLCVIFLLRMESNRVKRITQRLLIIWIIVLALPIYSLHLIPDINHLGVKITHFFKADFIEKTTEFINEQTSLGRAVSLPGSLSYLVHMQPERGEGYYLGLDPIVSNLKINTIEAFSQSPISNAIYESFLNGTYEKVLSVFGIQYILLDRALLSGFGFYKGIDAKQYEEILKDTTILRDIDGVVSIYENESFLPRFYLADTVKILQGKDKTIRDILSDPTFDIQTAVLLESQNLEQRNILERYKESLILSDAQKKAVVEFKEIVPTKYRVKVKKTNGIVPLVFAESYHYKWNIYSASKGSVDFSENHIWDTWLKKPLDIDYPNVMVNGYGNMWLIDIGKVCGRKAVECQKNDDGTYDVSFIVEYWPQRVFIAGVSLSLGFVIVSVVFLLKERIRSRDTRPRTG